MTMGRTIWGMGVGLATTLAVTAAASAECGLCAKTVIVNSKLASCFLEKYPQLSSRANGAVAIDLADCDEAERGVVAALRGPQTQAAEMPSLKFILSLSQLSCLKQKLEEPGLVLDPSLKIDLETCE